MKYEIQKKSNIEESDGDDEEGSEVKNNSDGSYELSMDTSDTNSPNINKIKIRKISSAEVKKRQSEKCVTESTKKSKPSSLKKKKSYAASSTVYESSGPNPSSQEGKKEKNNDSAIWKYFKQSGGGRQAICNLCNVTLCIAKQGTVNFEHLIMSGHLKGKHITQVRFFNFSFSSLYLLLCLLQP